MPSFITSTVRSFLLFVVTVVAIAACNHNDLVSSPTLLPNNPDTCRPIVHAIGEICVPAQPQRVVALSNIAAANLLSLGIQPIGVVSNLVPTLAEQLATVERIGNEEQVNFEKVLALQPDLILASRWNAETVYDRLSQIAPTVVDDMQTTGDWKQPFLLQAKALGMPDQADRLLTNYDQRIEQFREQMGDRLKQMDVSLVRIHTDGIILYLKNSFAGSILADIGLPRPPAQNEGSIDRLPFTKLISKERMDDADGDVIFTWTFGATPDIAQSAQVASKQVQTDPLWLRLNAVQQGQVYEVGAYWQAGGSPMTANLVLDDLFKYLLPEPQSL